jgi:hypothetical protein
VELSKTQLPAAVPVLSEKAQCDNDSELAVVVTQWIPPK